MAYTGTIFDFNGTIFWDTKLHNEAWQIFAQRYDFRLTDDELFRKIHGKNNQDIFQSIFAEALDYEKTEQLASEKEQIYRDLCLKTEMKLAPGLETFLDFLKSSDIPFTIATASGKENLDFYFEYLPLSKWFDYDKVVYNNGKIKSKPDPEIYQKAMAIINRGPKDVIVFEDAIMGLLAAKNAGAGNVIAVNSNDDDYSDWQNYQVITDYNQVDRDLYKK